jgi:high-affinity Fe2+/Pb2+ permease
MQNKRPLYIYVVAVAVVWAILLYIALSFGSGRLHTYAAPVCAGFFLGMLAMYIAVHVYKWK